MKRLLLSMICILSLGTTINAQTTFGEKVLAYINTYQDWAIMEQIRSGVPASITLAQGILETAAGASELCNNANNHFGIKCKSKWTGESYTYTDDAKDECFRKYKSAYESYKDHSDFLRNNPRYASLFLYTPIDYKSWAYGLKKCGYATNPQYAIKLIKFIEEYELHKFTIIAINKANEDNHKNIAEIKEDTKREVLDASFENLAYNSLDSAQILEYYVSSKKNGLNGFYGKKGDLLLEYALQHRIRYSKLLFWNDLADKPLSEDMFIYTESKRKRGLKTTHTFVKGETLHSIAQEEGIQLAQLLYLNQLSESDLPLVGSVLTLQSLNGIRVGLDKKGQSEQFNDQTKSSSKKINEDFITTEKKVEVIENKEPIKAVAEQTQEDSKLESVVERRNTTLEQSATPKLEQNKEVAINEIDEVIEELIEEKEAVKQELIKEEVAKDEVEYVEVKAKKKAKEVEKEMTPLEKLKAYMDETVYGEEHLENVANEPVQKETIKSTSKPTLPAAKQATLSTTEHAASKVQLKASKEIYHVVKKGETAFSISKQYGLSLNKLKELNKLPSSLNVSIGQKLRVN